jgi:hypothetical protein
MLEGDFLITLLRELIVEDQHHHSHRLYWEALAGAFYGPFYYSIRLVTDEKYRSAYFAIECRVESSYLTTDADLEALKEALIQAFKLGSVPGRGLEEVAGMEITCFLKKFQRE